MFVLSGGQMKMNSLDHKSLAERAANDKKSSASAFPLESKKKFQGPFFYFLFPCYGYISPLRRNYVSCRIYCCVNSIYYVLKLKNNLPFNIPAVAQTNRDILSSLSFCSVLMQLSILWYCMAVIFKFSGCMIALSYLYWM